MFALSLEPVPPYLQWVMPILKGTGNTLLCSRFVCGKRHSTRAKSVNSELERSARSASCHTAQRRPVWAPLFAFNPCRTG
jgi:hypothetical protein